MHKILMYLQEPILTDIWLDIYDAPMLQPLNSKC